MEKLQRVRMNILKANINDDIKLRMIARLDEAIANYDRDTEERRFVDKVLLS